MFIILDTLGVPHFFPPNRTLTFCRWLYSSAGSYAPRKSDPSPRGLNLICLNLSWWFMARVSNDFRHEQRTWLWLKKYEQKSVRIF